MWHPLTGYGIVCLFLSIRSASLVPRHLTLGPNSTLALTNSDPAEFAGWVYACARNIKAP